MQKTDLDERLDPAPPLHLLCAHTTRDFPGVAFDTRNDRMSVWSLLGPLIDLLNDNDLFPCLAALQHDGDL